MIATLVALALLFVELSLISFGGGNTILPEMQRSVVDIHHWMTAAEFSQTFALAQAAPGPNMMIVSLIGWHVAGWPGVAVTTLATFGTSGLITGIVYHGWERFREQRWRRIVEVGLAPVTAGLVVSGAAGITLGSATSPVLIGIAAVSAVAMLKTRLHPLVVLGFGALAGLLGAGPL